MSPFKSHRRVRSPRVAIVGGGPGGLFTAWHLERLAAAPVSITIFEASQRLGGKVLTPRFAAAPVRYEAGAAELYDYSPVDDDPLRQLVGSLGLPTVALAGSSVHLAGRGIANLDDVAATLGEGARAAVVRFDTWARSAMTPREFYESGSDRAAAVSLTGRFSAAIAGLGSSSAARYLETMIHSDLATEPPHTSHAYGLQNYLMNDPAYMRLYRIPGGNEQLIESLIGRLAAEVRLGAAVAGIGGRGGGRLTVRWGAGTDTRRDEFDAVVIALPLEPLAAIEFEDPHMAANMRRHVAHHDHPAHYLRVSLLLDRPVPQCGSDDDFLMVDAFGGACLYIESGRDPTACYGVLGWLLGGAAAAEMAARPDGEIVAAALAALPPPLAACRGHVLEARVHRWAGAVSGVPGGWDPLPVDRRHRPSSGHRNLFLVGDYLFDSTLNGALDSAEHVAGWLAAELADDGPAAWAGMLPDPRSMR